jgi:hypothetical protein
LPSIEIRVPICKGWELRSSSASQLDANGGYRRLLRMQRRDLTGRFPPKETAVALALKLPLICASPRATTPPSGVFVRFDSGRIRLNCGAIHFRQASEKTNSFECVSI